MEVFEEIAAEMLPRLERLKQVQWHYHHVPESPEKDEIRSWEWALDEMIHACKKPHSKRAKLGFELLGKYFHHLVV